tara:strand:+ start:3809 stop:4408 length:600 start_codon:yes stop_codon:yes gene_type:complete
MFFSKIISKILHPIFIPSVVMIILIKNFPNTLILPNQTPFVIAISIIFTLFLPLLSVLYFLLTKKIRSLEMVEKEERFLPLLASTLWMILGFIIMKEVFTYSPAIKSIYLGAIYTLVMAMMITIKWKISLHMIGIGGAVGVFLALQFSYGELYNTLLMSIFFSGILGYSRLEQKAHNLKQIYSGFMLGFLMMAINVHYL